MAEHNFLTSGPKAYYNSKGQLTWCHSKEDVVRARQEGFTSANYVRSQWPKTAYHKKTGESKAVGKLEWTDERNAQAVMELGPDWGLDHVSVPPAVEPQPRSFAGPSDREMAMLMDEFGKMRERIADLEAARIEEATLSANIRASLESRISDLESAVTENTLKSPTIVQAEKAEEASKTAKVPRK